MNTPNDDTAKHADWRMGGTEWNRNEDRMVTVLILVVLVACLAGLALFIYRILQ